MYITVRSEFENYVLWNKIVSYLDLVFEAYRAYLCLKIKAKRTVPLFWLKNVCTTYQ